MKPMKRHYICKSQLPLDDTRSRVVLEWALGLMRAQNGDLELGKFGPISVKFKTKINFSKTIVRDNISTHTIKGFNTVNFLF